MREVLLENGRGKWLMLAAAVALVVLVIVLPQTGNDDLVSRATTASADGANVPFGPRGRSRARVVKRDAMRARAHSKKISTPAAQSERAKSRTSYRHLSKRKALRAVTASQPAIINEPLAPAPALAGDGAIESFLSPTSAVIDLPNLEQNAVVQSLLDPLAVATPTGKLLPIDLNLQQAGTGFAPIRSDIAVQFPAKFSDGIRLGAAGDASGITIRAGSAPSAPLLTGEKKKLFYANTDTDTDTIAEALPRGAAVSWVLRSPAAPESLPLNLETSVGVSYELAGDGSAMVKFGDTVVAQVLPPTAFDAQGTPVAVRYVVSKTGLVVSAQHRSKALAYPIVVDPSISFFGVPAFRDEFGGGTPVTNKPGIGAWAAHLPTPAMAYSSAEEQSGYRLTLANNAAVSGPGFYRAFLDLKGPNTTKIFRAELSMVQHTAAPYGVLHAGLVNGADVSGNDTAWETGFGGIVNGTSCVESSPGVIPGAGCAAGGTFGTSASIGGLSNTIVVCAVSQCAYGGSDGNKVRLRESFNMAAGQSTNGTGKGSMRGGFIYYTDSSAPTLSGVPGSTPVWTSQISTFNPVVDDAGVGLGNGGTCATPSDCQAIATTIDGAAASPTGGPACNGGVTSPCPTHLIAGTADIPEGIHDVVFKTADITGRSATPEARHYMIDRSAPDVDLSGRLGAFALDAQILGNAQPRTVAANTPFSISVTDGQQLDAKGDPAAAKDRRSGVASISAVVNGANVDGSENTGNPAITFAPKASSGSGSDCDPTTPANQDSCPMSYDGNFNAGPGGLTPGNYYFRVTATDFAGNSTTKVFKVGVGVAEIQSVSEGQATARYVPLQIKRLQGSATAWTLQYRASNTASWCPVPSSAVKQESNGTPIGGWPLSLGGGTTSERLVADLDPLPGTWGGNCNNGSGRLADGEVHLRALMEGTSPESQRASEDVTIRYDRGGRWTASDF